jgi:hypothetical protein
MRIGLRDWGRRPVILLIIILIVIFAVPVAMYIRARQVVSVDVHGLALDEIVDIGTKSSEAAFRRVRGRAQVTAVPDLPGAVTWSARNGRVYTTYLVVPREDGSGYRIGAAALQSNIFKMFSIREMEAAHLAMPNGAATYVGAQFGTWLGQRLWLWSSARVVLYRRWRTLGALKRAGERRAPIPEGKAA